MLHVKDILEALATHRPIFHSEADFQHAFAWEIHQRLPDASIRLEFPVLRSTKSIYLDLLVTQGNTNLAIELKYKTRRLNVAVGGEQFLLKGQAAQLLGRYDFLKDIQRLEQVVAERRDLQGYAILLTNDSAYWAEPRGTQSVGSAFRLQEGRVLHSSTSWGELASAGTTYRRTEPLNFQGTYTLRWHDYSRPAAASYGNFRYLSVEIPTMVVS